MKALLKFTKKIAIGAFEGEAEELTQSYTALR
jgi:hypothetical protein